MKTIEKMPTQNKPELCEADRLFLSDEELEAVLRRTGMPVLLYDEKGLRERAKSLSLIPQLHVREIVVSDCPFAELLRIANEEGMDAVCCCPEELQLALAAGFPGERISYAGLCARPELTEILRQLGAKLWIGSPILIPEQLPERVVLLCNVPGRRTYHLSAASRRPTAGLSAEEAIVVAPMLKRRGVTEIGLVLVPDKSSAAVGALTERAARLLRLAEQIRDVCRTEIHALHLGSLPAPGYNRFKPAFDIAAEWSTLEQTLGAAQCSYRIVCDVSRIAIEPNAIFAAACLGVYEREKQTVQIDAAFRQLKIPQLDRYRHISLLGKTGVVGRRATDVLGTDLLSKDWFADSHLLPATEAGDRLIVHDVGCCAGDVQCFLVCTDGSLRRLSRDSDCFAESPDER